MAMVQWAPLRLPLRRRLQTLMVLLLVPYQLWLLLLALVLLWLPSTRWVMAAYLAWAWGVDRAAWTGARKSAWVRGLRAWNVFAEYFPVTVIKTADLPPDQRYVFGCHPHGVLPIGPFTLFCTEALGFSQLFPGIECYVMALNLVTSLPLARELSLLFGMARVDRDVCDHHLSSANPGRSIAIVVGGAMEALDSLPGDLALTILRRKGFVRIALRHGASLVPVLSFGETDLWDQVQHPAVRRIQEWLCRQFTFSLPLVNGRGVFQYSFGVLPHRRPLTVVVGAPIPCPKVAEPPAELVDEYHALYLAKLEELFNTHKEACMVKKDGKLILR